MQAILRLPFLALSCALILSGLALAAAAYTKNSEALVIALAFFLTVAAGAPRGRPLDEGARTRCGST